MDQVPVTGMSVEDEHMMSSMFIDEISIRVHTLTLPAPTRLLALVTVETPRRVAYILGDMQGETYGTKSQTVMLVSHDGDVIWHERTRVELVTDGENWETAHYVIYLEEREVDHSAADPDDGPTPDSHTEL